MEIDEDSDEGDFFESTQRSRRPSMEMSKEDDDDETNYESTKLSPVTSVYLGLASLIALENAPDFFQAIQEKILKSLETTFRNNVNSEPCSMLSLVFEFFKILTEPSEISPSLAAGLIKLLMRVPKQFLRPANFHVEAAHGLLDALYHLARHVHVSGADGEKKNFLVFVQAMIQMQSQSGYERFSIDLQSKIVSLIVRLIELDQNVEWAVWKGKMHNLTANSDRKFMVDDDQEMLPIGRCLYRFVCHGSHKIRSFAAVGIQRLISNAGGITMNVRLKRAELVHLIEVFDHLTNKDEVLDHCGTSEENSNRISTIMTTLGPLAVNCRSLEVEVITGILIFYKNINVPIQTLKKIFNIIANENFSEASKETVNKVEVYLTSKIGYIMNEFLKQGNEVTKFPYQLLNCPNPKRFLLKFESVLIPLCTWRTLSHALNFIGNILEKSPKDLVVHNFSMIVAYYIPISAMTNKEKKEEIVRSLGTNSDKVMKKVKKLHDLVYDILGEQRFGELLSENIAQVLAQVFKKLYDPKVLEVRFELKSALPLPNPPYTTEVLALNLIPYFTQYIDEGATLFSFLTKVKSDCLQIIAHELCSVLRVSAGARDLKIRALHGIDLFMRCLEKEVENLTEDLPYLIWFFVHSMLTLWKNVAIANDSDLLTCACVTITTILKIGMEHKISGTEKLFSPIKAVLVRQISRNRKYQDIVSLIVDYCCQNNPGIISQMGPFPDLPELQNINEVITALNLPKPKLSDVLKTFTFQEQDGPEDLANLCKALKAGKKDLNDMLNNLKNSKGRSEDAETSVLHSLICKLIDLTGYCKSNPEIAKSAAKCLGELGPLQLATAVLKPSSVVKVSVGEDPLVCFLPQMVKLFLKSLNHADNQHVDGATRALKSLLSFSGLKRMNLKSFFGTETFALVFPFIDAIKCDKNELDCEAFSQLVDDEDLWTRGSCHREWVVRIVTALLKSFTKGSAFRSCADICKVSPECCEQILPFIVHVILHSNWEKCRPILSQHFGNFFHSHFEKVRQDNASMDLSPSDSSTPGKNILK